MVTCDLFDVNTATSSSGLDHDYDGILISTSGLSVGTVKFSWYTQGSGSDFEINLLHYEGTTLTNTYATGTNFSDLPTSQDNAAPMNVSVTFPTNITTTTETRFVISSSQYSGTQVIRANTNSTVPSGLAFTYSNDNGASFPTTTSYVPSLCISSEGGSPSGGTHFPPPPLVVRF